MPALVLLRAVIVAGATAVAARSGGRASDAAAPDRATPAVAVREPTAVGTYVIRSVNGHALPFGDRIPATPGYEHRAMLRRAALRLDPDGAFRLTAHYAHEHTLRSSVVRAAPEKDDVVKGRWTLRGTALTLVPARSRRGRQPQPLVGRLTGTTLVLPYDVRTGATARRYVFVGAYDPSYF